MISFFFSISFFATLLWTPLRVQLQSLPKLLARTHIRRFRMHFFVPSPPFKCCRLGIGEDFYPTLCHGCIYVSFVTTLQLGEGRGNGHFTVRCKVLGDNLMGVPTNFGNDCSYLPMTQLYNTFCYLKLNSKLIPLISLLLIFALSWRLGLGSCGSLFRRQS